MSAARPRPTPRHRRSSVVAPLAESSIVGDPTQSEIEHHLSALGRAADTGRSYAGPRACRCRRICPLAVHPCQIRHPPLGLEAPTARGRSMEGRGRPPATEARGHPLPMRVDPRRRASTTREEKEKIEMLWSHES